MGEKEESSKSFWKGLVAGLGVALMVVALAIMASKVIRTFQMVGIIPSGAKESVANSQTVDKLSILEDTIQKYFWKEVTEEKMEAFDSSFDSIAGEKTEFLITNIAETRRFSIQTPDVVIKVNPERTDLVETKIVDGKQCLVIEINDQVEVNGVPVRTSSLE